MVYHDKPDESAGEEFELPHDHDDNAPLLPRYEGPSSSSSPAHPKYTRSGPRRRRPFLWICISLAISIPSAGFAACYYERKGGKALRYDGLPDKAKEWLDKVWGPHTGSAENDDFPADVGFPGPTPTGKEAALVVTAPALPEYTGVSPIVPPQNSKFKDFSIIKHWGNLSPYHSVKSHGLPSSSQIVPKGCESEQMHWLQRHGARYPTTNPNGPAGLATRSKAAKFKASGKLKFLNDWDYKLGAELLTPFGRSQSYNLGVSARIKYGFLSDRMNGTKPVFRTESQDRMLRSAQNFAAGFFGIPDEDQYNSLVMIEAPGFNCSLAPYHSCPNDNKSYPNVNAKSATWDFIYLKDARKRLQKMVKGYDITIQDARDMMHMCAYETVALGHSAFCESFTEKEWRGYEYRSSIYWWYAASFGSPVARAEGSGYSQELTARLTETPITEFNSSINSTYHTDTRFPLGYPLYADFTHDTTFAQLSPTMNSTTFAKAGPPPLDHIPDNWPFIAAKFSPFATNMQVQVSSCPARTEKDADFDTNMFEDLLGNLKEWWPFGKHGYASKEKRMNVVKPAGPLNWPSASSAAPEPTPTEEPEEEQPEPEDEEDEEAPTGERKRFVRLISNDAAVPSTGIRGCKKDRDGSCEFNAFVSSMRELIAGVDFAYDCNADYDITEEVTNGQPNRRH